MSVPTQLLIATLLVVTTVLIHLTGIALLLPILRRHRSHRTPMIHALRGGLAVLGSALGLFVLHTIEIWLWAAAYLTLHALPEFEQALYFSTSTFSTLGYGDVVLGSRFRILGAIEGANGILLFGWSTAFFFSVVDRLKLLERQIER